MESHVEIHSDLCQVNISKIFSSNLHSLPSKSLLVSRVAITNGWFLYLVSLNIDPGGGGVLPYMGHMVMCRCEGYGFQAVYSSIGYINQSIWSLWYKALFWLCFRRC